MLGTEIPPLMALPPTMAGDSAGIFDHTGSLNVLRTMSGDFELSAILEELCIEAEEENCMRDDCEGKGSPVQVTVLSFSRTRNIAIPSHWTKRGPSPAPDRAPSPFEPSRALSRSRRASKELSEGEDAVFCDKEALHQKEKALHQKEIEEVSAILREYVEVD